MKQIRPGAADRPRMVYGYSRHERTPRHRVIERNAAGTNYRALGALADQEYEEVRERLRPTFAAALAKRPQREVAAKLAAGGEGPNRGTVWRWLDQAVTRGLLLREGEGNKASPYRYWLPGQEEKWKDDPMHQLHEAIYQANAAALAEDGPDDLWRPGGA